METEIIRFKDIVDKAMVAVYVHDKDFNVIYVNDIVERATKYSKEELYRMKVLDLAYEDDVLKFYEATKRAFKGEEVFYEGRYVRKDGEIRWVWGFARPLKVENSTLVLGNWIDITKTKELEKKLKESEEFYKTLIEDSLTAVYIVQNDRLVYVNRAFEDVSGYRRDEVLGKSPFFIVHPQDRDEVYTRYLERLSGKREMEAYSWRIVTKNGKTKWITAKPSRIMYRGMPAIAATVIETTSIHQLNERVKRREEYVRLLNKILRHDILNALTYVRAVLEDREDELSTKALRKVDYITKMIKEMAKLEVAVEDLRAVRLDQIAKEVSENFEVEFEGDEVIVLANEGLRTVVFNLVQNAIQHSGGNVLVEVEKVRDWGILRVKDDGKGIPDEIKAKVFEEGFTTSGSGLGLFITKKLVELYDGVITAYDNEPRGTVFEVKLRRV